MVSWAHPNPQPKRHLDRFSHLCTAHVPVLYNGRRFLLKIVSSHGGSGPHLMCDCLVPSEPTTQTAYRLVQPFCTAHLRVSLYFTTGCPLKIAPSCGGLDLHLMHGSLFPPKSSTQTTSRSVQQFLHGSLL